MDSPGILGFPADRVQLQCGVLTADGDVAVDALSGGVDSARCVGHLSRLADELGPYRRSSGVAEFIDRTRPLRATTR